ncbi:MAG: ribose-phosphate diphosphokinase [Rhodospirillaceae bacterium]
MWQPDKIFGFAECSSQAKSLAEALGAAYETVDVHRFPDGESLVRVKERSDKAALFRSLHQPNEKLIEVILAAGALRDRNAAEVVLIAPYLPYMRQDIAFHPGEAVSQKIIGNLLAQHFDRFVSVDPHLHRTKTLGEVFEDKPALCLTAAPAITACIAARRDLENIIVVGPDVESTPLVKAVAGPLNSAWTVATKLRHGDREVEIALPHDAKISGRDAIVVDDIISSGATISILAERLRGGGAASVEVYATHALFGDAAQKAMADAGVRQIISCDSIPHVTNGIALSDVLAEGLRSWL